MAHAFTPGLKVSETFLVRKRRILPLKGDVMVKVGDLVDADTVVARTELPGPIKPINAASLLGVEPKEVEQYLLVKKGQMIEKGQVYAEKKSFFGLFKTRLIADERCYIEDVSPVTGQLYLRSEPIPIEVKAYIKGKVVEVIPQEGVVVETYATFIQGIFGVGGETHGKLKILVPDNKTTLTPDLIDESCKDCIIVGGNLMVYSAIKKAREIGVRGIIAGGINDKDLRDFLGYDLGVAITGNENIGITLLITEGFGEIDMAERTFRLLKKNEGKEASINGATQIRAGVIRPEVVIPIEKPVKVEKERKKQPGILEIGDVIRVIRVPYFGKLGRVVALPPEPQRIESESKARVLEVEFFDGGRAIVPRANVELIEEE